MKAYIPSRTYKAISGAITLGALGCWSFFQSMVVLAANGPLVECGQNDAGTTTGVLPGCQSPDESLDAGTNVVNSIIPYFINWFVGVLAVVAVLYIIWSGVQFITSLGSEDKVKKAQKAIVGILIGLLLAMASYIIISIAVRFTLK